jgi:hypothetical protein
MPESIHRETQRKHSVPLPANPDCRLWVGVVRGGEFRRAETPLLGWMYDPQRDEMMPLTGTGLRTYYQYIADDLAFIGLELPNQSIYDLRDGFSFSSWDSVEDRYIEKVKTAGENSKAEAA